jgi:hypothetical protein
MFPPKLIGLFSVVTISKLKRCLRDPLYVVWCDAEIGEDGEAVPSREGHILYVEREACGLCCCPTELFLSSQTLPSKLVIDIFN